jgi:hypothetical protein
MESSGMSPADVAAVVGNTDRNVNYGYPYPVMPMYGGNGFGNGMTGDGSWLWFILILALMGGWGNNGNGFGGGFGGGFNNEYAWLSNGQKEIMNNTNNGFDTLHLSNQIEGTRDAVHNISTQLCDGFHGVTSQVANSTANVTSAITNGFYNSEIAANNRQIADMQQNFSNQISTLNGFNGLQSQLAQCCCDNRLATCQTQNIVQNEANATRFADANNTRDIITNATANTQAILDKLCQLELDGVKAQLDAKNDKIADLQRETLMKDLQASQTAQNAFISKGFADEVDALYNRLSNCPVPSTPVYGRTPIFTCNQNPGCGCNGNGSYL